jgi:hypothetical protein
MKGSPVDWVTVPATVSSATQEIVNDLAAKMDIKPDILAGAAITACLLVARINGPIGLSLIEVLDNVAKFKK